MKRPPSLPLESLRRSLFIGLVLLLTAAGFSILLIGYAGQRLSWGDYVVLTLFPVLFSQISMGFVLAAFGVYDRLRGGDPRHLMRGAWRAREDSIPLAATAIVIPVFNEEVSRVAQGIENMWRSLEKTGQIEHFDFYLLSDSNSADHWVEEECAWLSLCRRLHAFGKIFYRKRHAINGKSGNVADFCRRWGRRYRYMIVLDADSVMTGSLMVRLVRAMEAHPQAGILQTQPSLVLGRSLFRRLRQFAASVYGGVFGRGYSFAQTSSCPYWGHNAILRTAPFIEHCDLPSLPVPDRNQRHILSHDTIEAALMQRAGYEVWLVTEEEGSYEEGPPNLSDTLKRDRRWCAGNLQHFWFLFARDISLGSRLQIWGGLMAYLSSPLWFLFLIAGSCGAYERIRFLNFSAGPEDLGAANASGMGAGVLLAITLVLLFAPACFGFLAALPGRKRLGGFWSLLAGVLVETLLSTLMAPILMVFHTIFVVATLLKVPIQWTTQNRTDGGLSWGHCLKVYGGLSVAGLLAQAAALYWLGDTGFWLTPICLGWFVAPALAWITARREVGPPSLFLTPEECQPPEELAGLAESAVPPEPGLWTQALLCPYVQAIHLSLVRQRAPEEDEKSDPAKTELRERLLREGPESLTPKQKLRLLWDAGTVGRLYDDLWTAPPDALHPTWRAHHAAASRNALLRRYFPVAVTAPLP